MDVSWPVASWRTTSSVPGSCFRSFFPPSGFAAGGSAAGFSSRAPVVAGGSFRYATTADDSSGNSKLFTRSTAVTAPVASVMMPRPLLG